MSEGRDMRIVEYDRWEFHAPDPERRRAPLPVFLLDVPYLLPGVGVIPPLELLNRQLSEGGSDGGMGPGATWEPFTISAAEYDAVVKALCSMDLRTLGDAARYVPERIIVDSELGHHRSHVAWVRAAIRKHGDGRPLPGDRPPG